jgi:phosphoglycerate dehydrogenase-like enzyme
MDSSTQSHKLLILSQHFDIYRKLIEKEQLPGLSIVATPNPSEEYLDYTRFDLVFGEPSLVTQILGRLTNLIWLQSSWAGVEPLLALKVKRDYILTNVRGVYGPLMSEYVFAYILAIERKILARWQAQHSKLWEASLNGSLKNKLIGLFGVGSIGARIAQTANYFGMRVYGYTRQSESYKYVDKYFHGGTWIEFARDLDYLVCTLPGTEATRNIINAKAISALPRKVWLVNVGRGSTLDETALIQALNKKMISGAILDVFKEEPLPLDHPLWSTPNTYITYHTAAQNNPPEIAAIFIENYRRLNNGESLMYQVDFELGY